MSRDLMLRIVMLGAQTTRNTPKASGFPGIPIEWDCQQLWRAVTGWVDTLQIGQKFLKLPFVKKFNPSVSPLKAFILPPLLAALSQKRKYVKVNKINLFLADALWFRRSHSFRIVGPFL